MPLQIAGKNVTYLSGPVAMNILSPREQYLNENPYAPIFILFGDVHGSQANFCIDYSFTKEDTAISVEAYRVHHEQFLKLLESDS